jgi:hypothetical protein
MDRDIQIFAIEPWRMVHAEPRHNNFHQALSRAAKNENLSLTYLGLQIGNPNHVRALDFQFDQTRDARVLKLFNITDECTKRALATLVGKVSISSDDMVRVLKRLMSVHETPALIGMDNGKIRDELFAIEEFITLIEAKIMAEDFRQQYNSDRPHSTLKYQTPDEFTLEWHDNNSESRKILAH